MTYTVYYIGITYVEASKTSILSSAEIFITVFLSHFLFKDDKINIRKIIGLICGVTGLLAVNTLNGKGFAFDFTLKRRRAAAFYIAFAFHIDIIYKKKEQRVQSVAGKRIPDAVLRSCYGSSWGFCRYKNTALYLGGGGVFSIFDAKLGCRGFSVVFCAKIS